MSLRKYIAGLAVAVLALLSLAAFTTEATAAVACPEESPTIYAGGFVELDLMCYDARVQHDGYHLFAADSDNPPSLGYAFSGYYTDEGGIEHNLLYYTASVGVSGIDTINYVLRKGTSGDDFVTGSIDVAVVLPDPVVPTVAHRYTKHHAAVLKWHVPATSEHKYKLLAGTYAEGTPRVHPVIKPGQTYTWKTHLKSVDFEVYLMDGQTWVPANSGHVNTLTGHIGGGVFRSAVTSIHDHMRQRFIMLGWGAHNQ
ncbi:hypothetical protein RAAC3_TM7C00001G0352 [Candidatus Saccharibacteria bacterium RAAC3_TM7_1]|nr:hypothetical protein RAAC3_TM7C00001G0352 [Candidatus Saccharibacteria bacterium RAAC3_TM7_1]